MPIKHPFVSGRDDSGDSGAVQPSGWNAEHQLTGMVAVVDQLPPAPNKILATDEFANLKLIDSATLATLDSPQFTGVPTAPTATLGTNTDQVATMAAVQAAIDALVGGAPGALNVLGELAAALGNDANFASTVTIALNNRLQIDAAQGLNGTQQAQGRSNLGIDSAVGTFLATPSSANLRAALTDETGTGATYFVGGALGTPASGTLTNATGLPLSTGVTGALPNANLATMANNTFKGNVSGSTAVPSDLTAAQVTAALPVATASAKGLAPQLPNDATKYLDGTGNFSVPAGTATPSLIDKFRGGTVSAELFTLANGVNEFDLIKVGSTYYFAYDDKTTTQLRSASTVAGLSSASDTAPVANLRYPSIQFDGTTWHLWGQNNTTSTISHYTASSFAGAYTLSDSMPSQFGDVNVRKFSNGKWYMACLDGRDSTRPAMTFVSNSASGPWTNMGPVFKDIGRGAPHAGEDDDEHIFEADGKVYLAFGAWDGLDYSEGQLPAICELDPHTLRAKAQPVTLVNATQSWQQRNSQFKLFNPIFLRESGVPDRIYYSHNVSTTGVAAGWGYIDIGTAPSDNRRDMQLMNVDFRNSNFDLATGRIPTLHGSTTVNSSGLTLTSSTGGAYGGTLLPNVDDFALCVDFTLNTLPGASTYQRVFRAAKRTADSNLISLWVSASAGGVVTMYSQVGSTSSAWTTVLTTGTRYRVMLTRQNGAVLGYVNGKDEYSATISGVQTLEEWSVGNSKGAAWAAGQQFIGVIRQAVFVSGKLYDTDFPG